MPELCDNCGQEASTLPAQRRPSAPAAYRRTPGRTSNSSPGTPPPCRDCGGEAARYRRPHTSCQDCRQEDHDSYRPLVNSPRDSTDCFDQRTPAEQREFEVNYTEIGHDPRTGMSVYAPKEAVECYGTARLMTQLG